MIINDYIDMTDTMYPSYAVKVKDSMYETTNHTTNYGYEYVDLESDNKDSYWKESVEEYHSMYRVYDKLIEERNKV